LAVSILESCQRYADGIKTPTFRAVPNAAQLNKENLGQDMSPIAGRVPDIAQIV
jgi:hypothetical protein